MLTPDQITFLERQRVARLATVDARGRPHALPVCYALTGGALYTPIDEKPKRAAPSKLKRIRNIKENPRVAIVIDHYDEDWKKLGYVLVFGKARVLIGGKTHQHAVRLLRRRYSQYRSMAIESRPMIAIAPTSAAVWGCV